MTYLSLRPTARFVRGPRRAALYDLSARRIYPLDEWAGRLIGDSLEGRSVESVLEEQGVRGSRLCAMIVEALSDHPLLLPTESRSPFLSIRRESYEAPSQEPAEPSSGPGSEPGSGSERGPGLITASGRLRMASQAASKAGARQRLDFLWLELTERCNLRCVHCYAGSGPGLKDGPMQAEDHLRVLREAAEAGCRRVQFTGGEATLHPAFNALVDEAKALGFERIEVYTNATLLNEERIRFLKERGVRAAVSFYSHRAEAHEAITQVPGSFRRTVESIRELVRAGVPVRVGLIRMSLNQDDTQPAHELLVGLGVPAEAITVDNVRPTGRGCGDSLVPSGGLPLMMSPPSGGEIQVRGNGELGCSTCWSGKVAVAPTGEVFPCIFSRELPAGNALGGSLRTVLENPILQDLWSIDKAQIPVCKDCEFRYGCFDCRALAYKQTGQLRSKPPSCTYDPYSGVWLQAATEPAAELPHETSVPVRPADLRCAVTGEIGVLYSKARQALLRVNRVAAEVCRLCDGRRSLSGIARRLARRYGEPVSRVARDVQALVGELARHGLLEVRAA